MHIEMRYGLYRSIVTLTTSVLLAIAGTSQVHAVKVVTFDSGTNQSGISGKDFVRGDNIPNDESPEQHGTTITRILTQYKPPGDVISFKVAAPSAGDFNAAISEAAMREAIAMPDIGVIDVSNRNPISAATLQAAVGAGKVIVTNSGNRAKPRPEGLATFAPSMGGSMIIVGAADANGNMEPYSNRAGDLAQYYVVAPGRNQFTGVQGTSFSKPHVSGIVALLLWRFPNLSPQDAVNIIFATAEDLGAPGVDPVFGHGRVNQQAALSPDGDMNIPDGGGDDGGGGSSGILIAGLVLVGGAIAYILTRKKPLETTLVLDGWDRAYTMDLTKVTQIRSDRSSLNGILRSLTTLEKTHVINQSANSTSFLRVRQPTLENLPTYNPTSWLNDDRHFEPDPSMSFYQYAYDGSGYSFHINSGITHEFGALGLASQPEDQLSFLSNNIFSSPFLGYSAHGHATHMTHSFTDNSSVSLGVSRVDDNSRYGVRNDAAIFEFTHKTDRYAFGASFGQLMEYGSMFGGSQGGPYSVDDTLTLSFGLSGSYRLSSNVRLIGNYTQGYSHVDSKAGGSLLSEFSGLRSDAWGMGLLFDNILRGRDRIGLAVSQPLKVTKGEVNLTVPQARSLDNVITSTTERVDLGSGGRELALETFYRTWIGKKTRFTAHLMHRKNPDHVTNAASNTSVLGILEYQF
ncbi:MAG: S8 family serine peptidase [Arenicellales bacterium]|nr:S8 family serine peptidase [Arenicellales bacterium]